MTLAYLDQVVVLAVVFFSFCKVYTFPKYIRFLQVNNFTYSYLIQSPKNPVLGTVSRYRSFLLGYNRIKVHRNQIGKSKVIYYETFYASFIGFGKSA